MDSIARGPIVTEATRSVVISDPVVGDSTEAATSR
jgi:hypothetical protein